MLDQTITPQSRLQAGVNVILEFHKEPLRALATYCFTHKLLTLGEIAKITNRDKSVVSRQFINREAK